MCSHQGSEAYGDHDHRVEERFNDSREAIRLDHGEHLDAGAAVVLAVKPGDGHEMGELPDEEDGEERNARPLDLAAGGGPAQQRSGCAGEGSQKSRQGGHALERGVDGDVGKDGEQGQCDSERIGGVEQLRIRPARRRPGRGPARRAGKCARRRWAGWRCGSFWRRICAPEPR